jgi:hypothetical protein
VRYGSSKSEEDLNIEGAKSGLNYTQKALDSLQSKLNVPNPSAEDLETAFHCRSNISGLNFWMWLIDQSNRNYLETAIEELKRALADADLALKSLQQFAIGRCAQGHLKSLFMLRMRDDDRNRSDSEGHRNAILAMLDRTAKHPQDASYLRCYQAITLADLGDRRQSRDLAIKAITTDAQIKDRPDCREIGRRQYSSLRRFLEQYSSNSPHSDCFGDISQLLQVGQVRGND